LRCPLFRICQASIDPELLSTHVFIFIRFSATNKQELCSCECCRLYRCAAFNKHLESLNIHAYYLDYGCKLRRRRFSTTGVMVKYFMCGHSVDWFPVINRHTALKIRPQTAKVFMFKDHESNYPNK